MTLAPLRERAGSDSGVARKGGDAASVLVRSETTGLEPKNGRRSRMITNIRRRRILIAALAGATFAALGITVASSRATETNGRELLKSTTTVGRLATGATYGASLIDPTPHLTPTVKGWAGAQFVDHQSGKVRYETALVFWRDARHEVDIISGPAMTLSPAATLAQTLSRAAHWKFSPYQPPVAVKR